MQTRNAHKVVLAAMFLFAGIATGQRQSPPEGGTPKDFSLPTKTTFSLENGLSVTMVPFGSIPRVAIRAVVNTGAIHQSENQVWLADLVGAMMKEGTGKRDATAIARDAARMGGNISVSVSDDRTFLSGEVLSDFAPAMIDLLADVLCNPGFPATELERLRTDKLREFSIDKSDPANIALEKFRSVMYGAHPYGRLYPDESMLEGYSIQDVRAFYESNFGAARTQLYVVGIFDAREVEKAVRASFAAWKRGPASVANIPRSTTRREIHIIDRPGAPQSTVYMGLPTIHPADPDYRALLVTNALLGGSFGSRITSNIREDKGYTYSPQSSISSRYRDAYWVQTASLTTEVTGAALKEIFYEINRLQTELPSAEELKGIQNYLAGVFVLQNLTPNGIINQLSFLNLHGLPDSYLTEYVKAIHAVTPAQVRELTAKYIRDKEIVIVIAGDRKKIEKQVVPFGKITS